MDTLGRLHIRQQYLITMRAPERGLSWRDLKEHDITIKHIYEKRDLYSPLSNLIKWNTEVSENHLLCAESLFVQVVFGIERE